MGGYFHLVIYNLLVLNELPFARAVGKGSCRTDFVNLGIQFVGGGGGEMYHHHCFCPPGIRICFSSPGAL